LFTYVKTCERGRVRFFNNGLMYIKWSDFFLWTRRPRYNGVAVYKQEKLITAVKNLHYWRTGQVVFSFPDPNTCT